MEVSLINVNLRLITFYNFEEAFLPQWLEEKKNWKT
jgi:hypothetical protein